MPPTGSISYSARYLIIECAPQVAQRLVRIFNGVKRGEHGEVIVSASDGNCYELEWIRQRFPLEIRQSAAEVMAKGCERHRAREALIAEARIVGYEPPAFTLALPPRDYQRIAADLVIRSGGVLVADDVGLGKTVTAIATMTAEGALPAIVITLKRLCLQWEREVRKFAPDLRVHVLTKGDPYPLAETDLTEMGPKGRRRIVKNGKSRKPDVVILNYHKLHNWQDELVGLKPGLVVFDECQELRKGEDSAKGEAAYHLSRRTRFHMGLSATPIYNYGAEIRNVMEAISPGLLGDQPEFRAEWCGGDGGDKAKLKSPEVMRAHLVESGAFIRRTRKEVDRELPPFQRIWLPVETDADKLKEVSHQVAELARLVLAIGGDPFAKMQAAGVLDTRLRMATGLAKAPGVVALIRLILAGDGHEGGVLVYAHHHIVHDAYAAGLDKAGVGFVRFTGKESAAAAERNLQSFIRGDVSVCLMAIRAGAGLDGIQKTCRTIVFGELDWSPGVHIQAEGRPHRDGQTDPVTAFYAVAEDGSDPPMQDVLGLKESQRTGLVDGAATAAVLEGADIDRVKKLAAAWLAQHHE